EILRTTLADNVKARELLPDGTYRRVKPADGETPLRSQVRYLELAEQAGRPPLGTVPVDPSAPSPPPAPRPAKRPKGRR
ncbi:MAG TPA: hypothetical protein VD866_06755, partial [Urbifossiella sp.]|nr:hypothetical protein [Urbifossiella sp.]